VVLWRERGPEAKFSKARLGVGVNFLPRMRTQARNDKYSFFTWDQLFSGNKPDLETLISVST
jgi:hypothetical protein